MSLCLPPVLMAKIYGKLKDRIADLGGVKKMIFQKSIKAGLMNYDKNLIGAPKLWNKIAFKKFQIE